MVILKRNDQMVQNFMVIIKTVKGMAKAYFFEMMAPIITVNFLTIQYMVLVNSND